MNLKQATYLLTSRKHGRIEVEFRVAPDSGKPTVCVFGRPRDGSQWTQKTRGTPKGNFRPNVTAAKYWAQKFVKASA